MASAVNDNAITSRSENLGTTHLLGIFPNSFTRFFENCLDISRIFPYFVQKLCIISIIGI